MGKPKLTIRPTEDQVERLYRRAEKAGYGSLSAYLIDCGLSEDGLLTYDRQALTSLSFEIRCLSKSISEAAAGGSHKVKGSEERRSLAELVDRGQWMLRLLSRVLGEQEEKEAPGR
jgi:hypothetical protein